MIKQITRSQFKILSKLEGETELVFEPGEGDEKGYYLKGERVNAAVVQVLTENNLIEITDKQLPFKHYTISDKGKLSLKTMQYKIE